jgi:hypothetical protein
MSNIPPYAIPRATQQSGLCENLANILRFIAIPLRNNGRSCSHTSQSGWTLQWVEPRGILPSNSCSVSPGRIYSGRSWIKPRSSCRWRKPLGLKHLRLTLAWGCGLTRGETNVKLGPQNGGPSLTRMCSSGASLIQTQHMCHREILTPLWGTFYHQQNYPPQYVRGLRRQGKTKRRV